MKSEIYLLKMFFVVFGTIPFVVGELLGINIGMEIIKYNINYSNNLMLIGIGNMILSGCLYYYKKNNKGAKDENRRYYSNGSRYK